MSWASGFSAQCFWISLDRMAGLQWTFRNGEHLRKARIDAGLLIKDLAKKLGVTEDTVINWEVRGRTPRPGGKGGVEACVFQH